MRSLILLLTAACVSLALVACGGSDSDEADTQAATLSDLDRIEQLRSQFNEKRGVPRLILILSPT
jgi:hypothetical protein